MSNLNKKGESAQNQGRVAAIQNKNKIETLTWLIKVAKEEVTEA
jgi:hypothetical protein